jgi:serine/threonine protein kinase
MRAEAERRIGPWSLHKKLGSGGNATVWAASRGGSQEPVALKVVNTHKVEREPYQRFVREIEFLRRLTNTEGVLQLIDAHLPEHPNEDRPQGPGVLWICPIGEVVLPTRPDPTRSARRRRRRLAA